MSDEDEKSPEQAVLDVVRGKALYNGLLQHMCFDFDMKRNALGYAPERLETSLAMMPKDLQNFLNMKPGTVRQLNVEAEGGIKFFAFILANEDGERFWRWSGGEVKPVAAPEPPRIIRPGRPS